MRVIYVSDVRKQIEKLPLYREPFYREQLYNAKNSEIFTEKEKEFITMIQNINYPRDIYEYISSNDMILTLYIPLTDDDKKIIQSIANSAKQYRIRIWHLLKERTYYQIIYHVILTDDATTSTHIYFNQNFFAFTHMDGNTDIRIAMSKHNYKNSFHGIYAKIEGNNDIDDLQATLYALQVVLMSKIDFEHIYDVLVNTNVDEVLKKLKEESDAK